MRLRLAGLIASAQRSMSLKAARESPQITEFLARLAISLTAAKSPSEAIGKPASMMSTPMASSSSATSSFSSWVMVAPGHCSPSRNVVSNMTTRSLSDWVLAVMAAVPSQMNAPLRALYWGFVSVIPRVPRRICPAGPQGRIRRRSEPRMRVAAEPAKPWKLAAVRSIAHICWRVVMALKSPSWSAAKVAEQGKTRVNRRSEAGF